MKQFLLSVCFLAGCGWLLGTGPHVPGAYQGTTPITVVNASDRELCVFAVYAGEPTNENWLGDKTKQQNLAPGARRTFSIKPGVYHVLGGFCAGGQVIAAGGTYGEATTTIQGPSLIALGPKPAEPIAGAATLAFAKLYPVQTGGGEAAPEPAAEEPAETASSAPAEPKAACKAAGQETDHFSECCSNRATMRGTLHNGGTRVCCTNDTDCQSTP